MRIWAGLFALCAIAVGVLAHAPAPAMATDQWECSNFSSQEQAQEFFYPGDPNNLDPDKDGIACEGLPCPCSDAARSAKSGRHSDHFTRGAERISKSLIAGLTRQSPDLQSWSFNGCHRNRSNVDCLLGAQGESISRRLACRYAITVSAGRRRATGRIIGHSCHSVSLPHLTMKRAKRAMWDAVGAAAGPGAEPLPLVVSRIDRLTIGGTSVWVTNPDPATRQGENICELRMTAELRPKTGRVTIGSLPFCVAP